MASCAGGSGELRWARDGHAAGRATAGGIACGHMAAEQLHERRRSTAVGGTTARATHGGGSTLVGKEMK